MRLNLFGSFLGTTPKGDTLKFKKGGEFKRTFHPTSPHLLDYFFSNHIRKCIRGLESWESRNSYILIFSVNGRAGGRGACQQTSAHWRIGRLSSHHSQKIDHTEMDVIPCLTWSV